MQEKLKVTVHSSPWLTATGHKCNSSREYWVVVGRKPIGPMGGKSGVIVDGNRVGSRYRRYEDALNRAKEIAIEHSYELI